MKQLQGMRIHKSCALILHVLVNYFLWPWHHSCMKSTRPAFYCLLFFRHHKYYAFDGYYDAWSIVGYKRFFVGTEKLIIRVIEQNDNGLNLRHC